MMLRATLLAVLLAGCTLPTQPTPTQSQTTPPQTALPATTPAMAAPAMAAPPGAPATAPPQSVVREIFRAQQTATGQPLRFPTRQGTLLVLTYDIPAGARLPVHRHPFQRYAYVLAGRLRVGTPDGKTWEYGPGDMVVEMLDQWHFGETLGTEPVRLLVIDQMEGAGPNLELRH